MHAITAPAALVAALSVLAHARPTAQNTHLQPVSACFLGDFQIACSQLGKRKVEWSTPSAVPFLTCSFEDEKPGSDTPSMHCSPTEPPQKRDEHQGPGTVDTVPCRLMESKVMCEAATPVEKRAATPVQTSVAEQVQSGAAELHAGNAELADALRTGKTNLAKNIGGARRRSADATEAPSSLTDAGGKVAQNLSPLAGSSSDSGVKPKTIGDSGPTKSTTSFLSSDGSGMLQSDSPGMKGAEQGAQTGFDDSIGQPMSAEFSSLKSGGGSGGSNPLGSDPLSGGSV